MADEFEPGPDWADKTGFPIGVPVDLSESPVLVYQALLGKVYTRKKWPHGSVARGEVPLEALEVLVGGPVKEGWYDATGTYLGAQLPGGLA